MGYDVMVHGSVSIPKEKLKSAFDAVVDRVSCRLGLTPEELLAEQRCDACPTTAEIANFIGRQLEHFYVSEDIDDSGRLVLFSPEDAVRHEEEDQWIFEALAPFIEDGEFEMNGEDGAAWKWTFEDGQMSELQGEMLFGRDTRAPQLVKHLLAVLYPDGKPVTAQFMEPFQWEQLAVRIENLVRESGFGPQAGMGELERLADV